MQYKKLFLASSSLSRQYLLREAQIPFELAHQNADEAACNWNQPIEIVVAQIAQSKMDHVSLFPLAPGESVYVLTADTLSQSFDGSIFGKPVNYDDAVHMIKKFSEGPAVVATSFCLELRTYIDGAWECEVARQQTITTVCEFDFPHDWISTYFERHPIALSCAGALAVERYGMLFLKSIRGSYSNIIGLPLVELRQALSDLGFFEPI